MVSIDEIKSKEIILEYPCEWEYKVILNFDKDIKEVIKQVVDKRDYKIKSSKPSKEGKYMSYTISLLVYNDDDRKYIYEGIKIQENVKIVL